MPIVVCRQWPGGSARVRGITRRFSDSAPGGHGRSIQPPTAPSPSAILPVASAFATTGAVLGIIVALVVGATNVYTCRLLIRGAQYTGTRDYESFAHAVGGPWFKVCRLGISATETRASISPRHDLPLDGERDSYDGRSLPGGMPHLAGLRTAPSGHETSEMVLKDTCVPSIPSA